MVASKGQMCGKWRSVTLGDCASLIGDKVDPATCRDTPYVGLEHIGQGTLSLIRVGTARDVSSTKIAFRFGDVLFGKLRPYLRKIVRPSFEGICSTDIWVLRPRPSVESDYLVYILASQPLIDFATVGSEGTGLPRANWSFVSRFPVWLPPMREQCAIARVLAPLDAKIELNRRMGETLSGVRDALLPKLTSGEIRCADADASVGQLTR